MNGKNDIWKDEQARQLADVLASISDPNEMRAFLRDVMTQKEIVEVARAYKLPKCYQKAKNTPTLSRQRSLAVEIGRAHV